MKRKCLRKLMGSSQNQQETRELGSALPGTQPQMDPSRVCLSELALPLLLQESRSAVLFNPKSGHALGPCLPS